LSSCRRTLVEESQHELFCFEEVRKQKKFFERRDKEREREVKKIL